MGADYKTVYVDVDNTLVQDSLKMGKGHPREIVVDYTNGPVWIVPNRKNIELVILFFKLGYKVVVWSKTGADWAELVCKAVGLDRCADIYLTKPMYYIDDEECSQWMGSRRWMEDKDND